MSRASTRPRTQSGFTLIELAVVGAIAAILLGVALPSFYQTLDRNRLVAQTNEFNAAFAFARSEAVRLNREVQVCPINADDNGCDAASSWARGWLVWSDTDESGAVAAAEILRIGKLAQDLVLTTDDGTGTALAALGFSPRGARSRPAGSPLLTLQAHECVTGRELVREMTISLIGLLTTTTKPCP